MGITPPMGYYHGLLDYRTCCCSQAWSWSMTSTCFCGLKPFGTFFRRTGGPDIPLPPSPVHPLVRFLIVTLEVHHTVASTRGLQTGRPPPVSSMGKARANDNS